MSFSRPNARTIDPETGSRSWRLQARRARRKLLSSVAIAALLASGGIVAAALAPAQSASAATLGPIQTSFEIDGNTAGANDWQGVIGSTPKPPYVTASGDQSTGIIDAQRTWDAGTTQGSPGVCGQNLGIDDIFVSGTKLDDPTWPLTTGTANDKGDACTGGSAYEVVTDDGVQHTIFYAYWTRYSGSGDMTSYELFQGPADGRSDDYLIEFNYNSGGGGSTSVNVLGWNGFAWVPTGGTIVYQAAVGANTDTNTTGNAATFGEMAVDLTASGLLPSDGACRTFLDAGFITKTGEGGPATLKDILVSDHPITLSNCGGLVVEKVANPADATSEDVFDYTVTRTGGGTVHDGTLTGPVLPQANNNAIAAPIGVGDTHTWGNVFAGSDYQLAETVDAGQPWVHQSTVCTVTNPSNNQLETYTNEPFKLYIGAQTTCVITNATSGVTITKLAEGDPTTFDFTINGTPVQVDGGQSSAVTYFVPGSVVTINEIAEVGTPAWHLTDLVCDQPATVSLATGSAVVTTVAGQISNCTFTNTQDGQVRIIKNVAGANGTFDFTSTLPGGNFDLTTEGGTQSKLFESVAPGTYTVTETSPVPAYDLTSLSCVEDVTGDSVANLVAGTVTVTVQPGELVTCTYTNTQRGNIIVTKQTNPDGSDEPFDFTLTGQSDFVLHDDESKQFMNIVPGAYTLTELAKDGWDVTSMTCSGEAPTTDSPIAITLSPGETVECTVLNTATKGRVTVEKNVTGVPEGYDWSFPISISPVPAGQQGTINATDDEPIVEWKDLDVGTQYTLTEGDLEGWDEGTITCTGIADESDAAGFQFTVTPGLSLECEVTNDAEPGEVSVTKTVAGVADDTAWEFDLTIDPADGVAPGATQTVSGTGNTSDTVTWTNLVVGEEYTITEALPVGWTGGVVECGPDSNEQLPGDQFVVTPGFSLECSVRNEADPASAKITKTSVGAGGSFTFVLTPIDPAGDPVEQVIVTPAGGGVGETTFTDLVPGATYSLAEQDPGAGWVAGDLVCEVTHAGDDTPEAIDESSFTVEPGDVFECEITNTAKGTIIIVKNIDGADGTFQFTGTWPWADEPSIGSFGITTENGTGANSYGNVVAGSYSVTELLTNAHVGELQGCVESRAGGADDGSSIDEQNPLEGRIDLDPGETVTCTYSNTELGKIIVDKNVTFDNGQSFDFEYSDGIDTTPFALTGDAAPWESDLIEPGTYTVEELGEANWMLQSLQCVGSEGITIEGGLATIELLAGEVVTCTYVNAPDTGDVTVRKIVEGVPQGYPFDFEITISPSVGAQAPTQHVTQDDSSVSWTDLLVGETYTLTEGDEGGWNEGEFVCNDGNLEDADEELAGFQFVVTPGLSLSCTITNTAEPGEVTVTKHVTGVPDGFEWEFPLTIAPADGVLPQAEQTVSGTGDETDSVTWTNLEIGTVYTVTEGELPEGWSGGTVVCTDTDPQTEGNQFVATPGASLTCDVTNEVIPPTGLITKDLVSIAQATDGTWDLVYEVKVTNQSPVAPLVYDLDDQPYFGVGVVINEASAAGPSEEAADWDPTASNYVLADDAAVPASQTATYTITINATVPEQVYDTSQDICQPGNTTEGGFRNTAFLTVGDAEPQAASDCDEPGRTTVTKELVGSPENLGGGDWRVVYEVIVTSESDDLDLYYDLEDDLGFPVGVTIEDAEATNDAGVDTTGWDGEDVTVLADDELIAPLDAHTYTISVVGNVANITAIDTVTCLASTSGHGFFNEATLLNGTVVTEVDDCATIPVGRLKLQKIVDNSAFEGLDLKGYTLLEAKDWLLSGTLFNELDPEQVEYLVAVLGDGGVELTVPVGDYALAEDLSAEGGSNPLRAFYVNGDWSCDDESSGQAIAEVVIGQLTSCSVVNTGYPVDLAIVKEDVEEIEEVSYVPTDVSSRYQYTFTVVNNGEIAAPNAVITDEIPDTIAVDTATWAIPAGWTAELTGTVDGFGGTLVLTKESDFLVDEEFVFTFWVTTAAELPREGGSTIGKILDIVNTAVVDSDGVEATPGDNTSTETTPVKSVEVFAEAFCRNDTPVMSYEITPYNIQNVDPLTIVLIWWTPEAFANRDPSIPASDTAAILADGASQVDAIVPPSAVTSGETLSGEQLWPGAAVDANGDPIAWPGWRHLPTGQWILDPTAPFYDLRDTAVVEVRMNPSTDSIQAYPPASPDCNATPPGFNPPPPGMASTGVDSAPLLWGALGLVIVGGMLFGAYLIRRRRIQGES